MRGSLPGKGTGLALLCLVVLGTALLLAGCTGTAPLLDQGSRPAVTTPALPSYLVHIQGRDRGAVLLVGRSTCPWCLKTQELLANLSVDYYWVDLNTLDQKNTSEVIGALKVCGQMSSVPVLMINGQKCIIGYQEEQIREALG
jgi:glutaredoxin-like protein NrdH